jgi:hypothetical protein
MSWLASRGTIEGEGLIGSTHDATRRSSHSVSGDPPANFMVRTVEMETARRVRTSFTFGISSAGEFGHALLKRDAMVDGKPLRIAASCAN